MPMCAASQNAKVKVSLPLRREASGRRLNEESDPPGRPPDQCDGKGFCVDCVDSGGCEECCFCANNVCVQS